MGCIRPEGATGGYEVCTNMPGTSSRIAIKVRFGREAVTEADPGNHNRLSNEESHHEEGQQVGSGVRGGYGPGPLSRYMGQPACERADQRTAWAAGR